MAENNIEAETTMAIDQFLADAIKEDMVERFKGRYDLDLLEYVRRELEANPRSSWRGVLREGISAQGVALRGEIEAAVREYLPDDDE
jgi:hypothetical protein